MPYVNAITDQGQGIVTTCSGVLTAEEFIGAVSSRYEPPEHLRRVRYIITDHSAVDRFDMDGDDIYRLVLITSAAARINRDIHLVSVAPSDVGYGLVRIWRSYADQLPWAIGTCRSRADAERWLKEQLGSGLTFR